MIEPQLLTEVPAALKRLAKQVVRGFYGVDHALALDVLIRNPCVREEDMLELLKFDRKQLRSVLNTLKADKFVKCRMRVETAPDGKTTRHNYYFINYRLLMIVFSFLVCIISATQFSLLEIGNHIKHNVSSQVNMLHSTTICQ